MTNLLMTARRAKRRSPQSAARQFLSRAAWFEDLAPGLKKQERSRLSPAELARWRGAREAVAAIRGYAKVDAARSPLQTPCLDRWRAERPVRYAGPLYEAACWEAAAVDITDSERRALAFAYARAIIAVARGELVPFLPVAEEWSR